MTAPGELNYPPDLVPAMETVITKTVALQALADETKKLAEGLVRASAGEVFVNFDRAMTTLCANFKSHNDTALALGNRSIQAHGDMMDTDRRAARQFD